MPWKEDDSFSCYFYMPDVVDWLDDEVSARKIVTPHYRGKDDPPINEFDILDVKIYNTRAIVVTWGDGSKTKAVRSPSDPWDLEAGLMVCYFKRFLSVYDDPDRTYTLVRRGMLKAVDKAEKATVNKMKLEMAKNELEEKRKRKLAEKDARRKEKRLAEVRQIVEEAVKELRVE